MKTFREWLSPVVFFSNNLISLAGVVVVTARRSPGLSFCPLRCAAAACILTWGSLSIFFCREFLSAAFCSFLLGFICAGAGCAREAMAPAHFKPIDPTKSGASQAGHVHRHNHFS